MDANTGRPNRVYLPAFGPIEAVLGYALFYVLVDLATATLATHAPSLAPEPLATWAAIVLWVMLALVVLGQVAEQSRANPHTFSSATERRRFLENTRPSIQRYSWWGVWVLVGGTVTVVLADSFFVSFPRLVRLFVGVAVGAVSGPSFRFADAVPVVGFFLGFSLTTRGLDRLLVGAVRSLLASAYLRSDDV